MLAAVEEALGVFDDWHLVVEHHADGFEKAHAVFALENLFIQRRKLC